MDKLYVVRHADAGTQDRGDEPDEGRPLSKRGRRQATALGDQLVDAGIKRLVASPFLRCCQTLQPLGDRLGIEVEVDERLAEGQGFAGALAIATELRGSAAAICSHGDVIPDLLEALVRRGMKLKDARWQRASTWVLTRDGDGFSKATYLPPPA
ncbi:MAG: phosphoglycerate mutase family protein [Acidimicrobiales bacterium]